MQKCCGEKMELLAHDFAYRWAEYKCKKCGCEIIV